MNQPEKALAESLLIFAHGAGAGMDSEFILTVTQKLEKLGIEVVRFEFPYMQKIRQLGKRRPPDRMPKLIEAFEQMVDLVSAKTKKRIFIGGKSMGGRVASLIASQTTYQSKLAGVICMGFPFHPPKKPEKYRGEHLAKMPINILILQGERDPFGGKEEITNYQLSDHVQLHFLHDGDHSFKPRKRSGLDLQTNISEAVSVINDFCAHS